MLDRRQILQSGTLAPRVTPHMHQGKLFVP